MKALFFTVLLCGHAFFVHAQLYTPEIKVENIADGKVGIGTNNPLYELDVFGNLVVGTTNGTIHLRKDDGNVGGDLSFLGKHLRVRNSSGTGTIGFYINAGGGTDEVLRISNNGNIGIGYTNPQYKLHISGPSSSDVIAEFNKNGSGAQNTTVRLASNSTAGLTFGHQNNFKEAYINHSYSSSTQLRFMVRNSTKMTILNNGQVGIGTTSPDPGAKLEVNGEILADNLALSSDQNLKENIRTYNQGIDLIKQINPVKYKFKPKKVKTVEIDSVNNREIVTEEFEENNRDYIGVLAQDIQGISPDLIHSHLNDEGEEILSVNFTAFTFILINAVKEQQALIEELQNEIKALSDKQTK